MYKLYFPPHLYNENSEWLTVLPHGTEHHLTWKHHMPLRDYDLVFVKRGYVRYYCNSNLKKDNFTLMVGQNSLVNISGVITGANRFSHIATDTFAEIVVFNSYSLWDQEMIVRYPELYIGLASTLKKTLTLFSCHAHMVLSHACLPRFCNMLLEFIEHDQIPHIQHVKGITQNDLAQLSGMHPVTMSKVMKKLRTMGVVGKLQPTYLEILDLPLLTSLGTPDPEARTCSLQVSHASC